MRDQLTKAEELIRAYVDGSESELKQLRDGLAQDKARIAELEAANKALQGQNADQASEIADLRAKLAQDVPVSRASPIDLAKSFRAVVDEIQADARAAPEVGVTIKSMDIELKGLVEIEEDKTALVLPSAKAQIDPSALSTLRVSFGAVPVLPQAEAPPEPEPPRVAPRRRRPSG